MSEQSRYDLEKAAIINNLKANHWENIAMQCINNNAEMAEIIMQNNSLKDEVSRLRSELYNKQHDIPQKGE